MLKAKDLITFPSYAIPSLNADGESSNESERIMDFIEELPEAVRITPTG